MNLEKRIKTLCVHSNISVSELARQIGTTPQNFFGKLKRESFTIKDYKKIANVTNSDYKYCFILKNGEEI